MSVAVFSTFCEYNQEYYYNRIKHWYDRTYRLFENTVDYYVICDGFIKVDTKPMEHNINFVELIPALGRKTAWIFPGWKRSYYVALKSFVDYEKLIHIENDVKILNTDKFLKLCLEDNKSIISMDSKYNFIEPSIQILNNKADRSTLCSNYDTTDKQSEDIDFEVKLTTLIEWNVLLKSYRLEGEPEFVSDFDAFCQISGGNEYSSK